MEKEKKVRKKYPRETTVRFSTNEAKVLLMGMNYAKNREIFLHEGDETERIAYAIMFKLKDRIEKEKMKKMEKIVEVTSANKG